MANNTAFDSTGTSRYDAGGLLTEKESEMTELNVAELQAQLVTGEGELRDQQAALRVAIREQKDAVQKIGDCHRVVQRIQWEIQKVKDLLTIASIVIPEELIKQRDELRAKEERVQRKDITVAEQEALTKEIEDLAKHLPDGCAHPYVVGYPGYPGDWWNEWEGSYHGHRMCFVCNYDERSSSSSEDAYTTLIEKEGRLIGRVSRDTPKEDMHSIEEIREAFIATAG